MSKKEIPYFNIQQDGHWTWQCPHEPTRDVYVTVLGQGEMVYCEECAKKIIRTVEPEKKKNVKKK